MADDVLISCEGVSKKFCRSLKRSLWYGVADMASEVGGAGTRHEHLRKDEFWAVDDVSFELRRGECLGLIGRNGAGKTTLLRMLNGLIKPDRGHITIRGRVGALIALGAGFNPILSGRENIYVNASVLGLRKPEVARQINAIIDFAEIGEFIDAPVQSYSSGMQVRLGFAVATALDPDILLLDEVLAVGDARFRSKCYNRIDQLCEKAAVIFVSHNPEQIGRICSSTLVLSQGSVVQYGATHDGLNAYRALCASPQSQGFITPYSPCTECSMRLESSEVPFGSSLRVVMAMHVARELSASPRLVVFNTSDEVVAESNVTMPGLADFNVSPGRNSCTFVLGPLHLQPGPYRLSVNLHVNGKLMVHGHHCLSFRIAGLSLGECATQLPIVVEDLQQCT